MPLPQDLIQLEEQIITDVEFIQDVINVIRPLIPTQDNRGGNGIREIYDELFYQFSNAVDTVVAQLDSTKNNTYIDTDFDLQAHRLWEAWRGQRIQLLELHETLKVDAADEDERTPQLVGYTVDLEDRMNPYHGDGMLVPGEYYWKMVKITLERFEELLEKMGLDEEPGPLPETFDSESFREWQASDMP